MKVNKLIWMALAILLGVGTGTAGAATNEVSALLQQGLFEEEANQNLDAAIQAYQSVIAQTEKNRQFAATAIFRLGECYRKQGKTNEAAAQYQRILRHYADQPELAKLSRQYLAGMGVSAPGAPASAASGTGDVSSEARVLAGQISAIEQLKADPEEQARGVLAIFPDDTLKEMLLTLHLLQDQVAFVKANPKLPFGNFGGYRTAVSGDGRAQGIEGESLLTNAELQLSKQLSWIGDRVDFIMANQKARLRVLQLALGTSTAPAISDAALQTQKQLLDEEIKVVEQQLESQQARVKQGVLSPDELSSTQMKLLELKRQRAALDAGELVLPQTPAAVTGDEDKELARLQTMIQNTPDLITSSSGELVKAARNGQLRVAAFLLDHGANINGSQADARPLVHAAAQDQKTMVDLLLSRGADINVRDQWGETALIDAAEHGYKSVVEDLLARHAEVNSKRPDGDTALHMAAQKGFADIAALLITNGADVDASNEPGETPLHTAARTGNIAIMQLLIDHRATIDARASGGGTPLLVACQGGQAEAAALLLKNNADVNAMRGGEDHKGWMPLHFAVDQNRADLTKLLLENHAGPNARISAYDIRTGGTAGGFTAYSGQVQDVTPLMMAVINRQTEIVQLLIAHKADVNAKDANGDTPLTLAASPNGTSPPDGYMGQPPPGFAMQRVFTPGQSAPGQSAGSTDSRLEIAELLLDNGTDANAQNKSQQSALSLAVVDNSPELVKLLLQHKAKVDVLDQIGLTPLFHAVEEGKVESAGLLLDAGANPEVKFPANYGYPMYRGLRLLGYAVQTENKPMVEMLLAHKADPNAPDDSGETPLSALSKAPGFGADSIQGRNMGEIAALLRGAGANDNLHRLSTISVSRDGANYTQRFFHKEAGVPNHFTLLDLVAATYAPPYRGNLRMGMGSLNIQDLPGPAFPDFGRIRINRLQKDGRTNVIPVDLNQQFSSGDCSKEVSLEWGDVVEIPEADHNINEPWPGLSDQARAMLRKCLASQIVIMVKGKTNLVTLKPLIYRHYNGAPGFGAGAGVYLTTGDADETGGFTDFRYTTPRSDPRQQSSFWLYDVVHDGNVILTSSDLSRVKVTRRDPTTRKTVEMTFDLQKNDPASQLWLRDGDVIELPEKP